MAFRTRTLLCGVLCQYRGSVFPGHVSRAGFKRVDKVSLPVYTVLIYEYLTWDADATTMINDLNTIFNNAAIPTAVIILIMAIVVTLMQRNIHRK